MEIILRNYSKWKKKQLNIPNHGGKKWESVALVPWPFLTVPFQWQKLNSGQRCPRKWTPPIHLPSQPKLIVSPGRTGHNQQPHIAKALFQARVWPKDSFFPITRQNSREWCILNQPLPRLKGWCKAEVPCWERATCENQSLNIAAGFLTSETGVSNWERTRERDN